MQEKLHSFYHCLIYFACAILKNYIDNQLFYFKL